MNTYRVIFHSTSGEKFTTFINGNNIDEAMENISNHYIEHSRFSFYDKNFPEKQRTILHEQHVFYTEYILEENGILNESSDKLFELFSFPQFVHLSDEDMKLVISNIKDDDLLAKALKNTNKVVALKFFDNMDRQKKLSVTVSEETVGNIGADESNIAQKYICEIALQLAAEGEITLK